VGVEALPSTDYGILQCFDASASWTLERVGILDVLLACIAKALTLQVKTKGRDKETSSKQVVTSVTMASIFDEGHPLGSRWWMRGSMPRRVAESIIQLVKDMASVRLLAPTCPCGFFIGFVLIPHTGHAVRFVVGRD